MEKSKIRKNIKEKLEKISEEEYLLLSSQIQRNLFLMPLWKQAKTIALTVSKGREVDTIGIIKRAWSEKKKVAVPKCNQHTFIMEFREISSFKQLENTFFGLQEPKPTETKIVLPKQIDLMIVPGVCFDVRGYRVGYGGGYYDRYLRYYNNELLSLAFNQQIIEYVPTEEHDIPIPLIITEKVN